MNDRELQEQLKRLRRRVEQLHTEFAHQHLDQKLLVEIDTFMENGISADKRATGLRSLVDGLRENVLVTGHANYAEAIRQCVRMKKMIDGLISDLN